MSVRIAVIGAGAVAARHVRVLSGFDDARVVAVADPVAEAADRLASSCGARGYADAERLLERERVDAVYVCVPPFAHGEPERAVLARGLPLFVEKPLAADLDTAESLAAEVRRAGVVTGTGYHWRCLDTVRRAAELLADAPARLALGSWLDKLPPPAWWPHRALSGGPVVEQLTHVLDLARALVGEVELVHAVGSRTDGGPGDVDDVTAASLRYRTGAVGTVVASSLLSTKHRAGLQTVSAGGLVLDVSEQELVVERDGRREGHRPAVDGRRAVDREFLDTVTGRRESTRMPYGEALATHQLGCALARSAATGAPVPLAPVPVGAP
ncbi:MAG TPA: Gfo/Idh/MocA family oxidoreductase [Mycobacteriales bacterium]|nr:Gfo/Idh/MocA family oxidoreductase [Mycobacteriales bacterium]